MEIRTWDEIARAERKHDDNCQCVFQTARIESWCELQQHIYRAMERLGF